MEVSSHILLLSPADAPSGSFHVNDKTCRSTTYLTPPRILDAVRRYFQEEIDLDPATEPDNPTGAATFYTGDPLDGLKAVWSWPHPKGNIRVFLNPPYGRELKTWTAKLYWEAHKKFTQNPAQAQMLPPVVLALLPGQRFEQLYWQQYVFNRSLTGFCMVRKRVNFLRPDGTPAKGNPYGSFVYLYNGDFRWFCDCFGDLGLCVWPGEMHTRVTS